MYIEQYYTLKHKITGNTKLYYFCPGEQAFRDGYSLIYTIKQAEADYIITPVTRQSVTYKPAINKDLALSFFNIS